MIKSINRKFQKSLRNRGVVGTAIFTVRAGLRLVGELTPERRRTRQRARDAERAFDTKYNVDTSGTIPLSELNVEGKSWHSGNAYQGVWPSEFHDAIRLGGIETRNRTFVDLGCGKGRAMLLAAECPFSRIIGVELASELAEIAKRNIVSYRNSRQVCFDLSVVHADAAQFKLPDEPLVVFLYNPFEEDVMQQVVENINSSLVSSPRDMAIIYLNPQHDQLWNPLTLLKPVVRSSDLSIYEYKPMNEDGIVSSCSPTFSGGLVATNE